MNPGVAEVAGSSRDPPGQKGHASTVAYMSRPFSSLDAIRAASTLRAGLSARRSGCTLYHSGHPRILHGRSGRDRFPRGPYPSLKRPLFRSTHRALTFPSPYGAASAPPYGHRSDPGRSSTRTVASTCNRTFERRYIRVSQRSYVPAATESSSRIGGREATGAKWRLWAS